MDLEVRVLATQCMTTQDVINSIKTYRSSQSSYKLHLFLLILAGITSACESSSCFYEDEENLNIHHTIKIDPNKANDMTLYSSIFEKIDYIPIETNDTFLIGSIDKLLVTTDYLFILDRQICKTVFCTDSKGKALFKIHKLGNGPGEYIDINDIEYDKHSNELLLLCSYANKILYFNTQGEFIREKKIPMKGLLLGMPPNNNTILYRDYCVELQEQKLNKVANLILCNKESQITESAYFSSKVHKSVTWTSFPQFSKIQDTLSIKPDHSGIVYHIYDNQIKPIFRFDFGEYNIDKKYWEQATSKGMTSKKMHEYTSSRKICESKCFFETNDALFLFYRQGKDFNNVFFSKKSGKTLHSKRFINDMNCVSYFYPVATFNNYFYSILDPERIVKTTNKSEKQLTMGNLINQIQLTDNPVIARYTIKKF